MSRNPAPPDARARETIRASLDRTLAVEAAAGTGKTTVLVDRMVNVLASGVTTVDRIVAVTFTEKAAGELKLRLRTVLEAERGRTSSGGRRAHLENALARLEEANVSTIHGFCADLLRERPVEAGVDPRFTVLTEPQAQRLFGDTFLKWLHEQLERPGPGVRRALRRQTRRDFGVVSSGAEDGPSARLRQAGWTLAEWRDFPAAWRLPPFAREDTIDRLLEALQVFAELAGRPASSGDSFYLSVRPLVDLADRVRHEERLTGRRDYEGLEAQIVAAWSSRVRRPRKGSGTWYRPEVPRRVVHEAHETFLPYLDEFVREADADLAARLQLELRETVERYQAAKRTLGALDFLDLLLRARDLVKDHGLVRRAFQQRFTHVFVDEFQDTDPVQAELLLLLAADDPDQSDWRRVRPLDGKLFIVGDPKQSIYRFRRADVGVYHQVRDQLVAGGAEAIDLTASFRAVPDIQTAVNRAFRPVMTGDRAALQASYVPLSPVRAGRAQPALVALSVPDPYSDARVTNAAIATTVPPAVGAFLEWLFTASGWHVSSREVPGEQVPVAPGHVCLLFRRFDSLGVDVTRPYVEALEARSIPHLLVGGRSFHDRDEVETMRTALVALEWPDDELAVFGALRGSLFALSDETLFRYREAGGRWHPFHRAGGLPDELRPVQEALECLRDLHLGRNHRPIAETVSRLLDAARAHAGFALRNAGEQALANVLQIAEMARQYELNGGISFRGFVEQLRDDAGATRAEEAPVVEEGSDGVRLMTVHRAKGLEFPVVVLCDITAPLTTARPSRYLDPSAGLCAVRLAGWSPTELLEHEDEELEREASEGIRVAYVAATRARDLLVVPALADKPYEGGWVSPLNAALYPPRAERGQPLAAEGCPAFGRDGVVTRDGPRPSDSVTPGRYVLGDNEAPSPASYEVVWWDPSVLDLERAQAPGIRGEGLIAKDAPPLIVEEGLARFRAWQSGRDAAIREAARPTRIVRTVRQRAADEVTRQVRSARTVDVVDAMSDVGEARPGGPRFGALVHAALAVTPLAQDRAGLDDLLAVHARLLGAEPDEVASARRLVRAALAHPLLARAAAADRLGRCRRELPVAFADGHEVCEGVVDLAFEEADGWTIVDFKTDRAGGPAETLYEHQVALYAEAVARATGRPVRAVVLRV